MNSQFIPDKLLDYFTISTYITRGDSVRVTLRTAIINATGLNPKDANKFKVFFRQYLSGVTFSEIYDELSKLSNNDDNKLLRFKFEASSVVDIKETHWYRILRYFLFCYGPFSIASVVFLKPTSTVMDLFILSPTPIGRENDVKGTQRLINQMMAVKIALWLTKPPYLSLKTDEGNLDKLANYNHLIAKALFDALNVYNAARIEQLREILFVKFAIKIKYQMSQGQLFELALCKEEFPWIIAGEMSLSVSDIEIWMKFNQTLENFPMAERIRKGANYHIA